MKSRLAVLLSLLAVTLVAYATTKTENFSGGAETPISGTWTTIVGSGCNQTAGGQAQGSSGYCVSAWSTSDYTFLADQSAQVKIFTPGNDDNAGPCVRLSTTGGGQGYCAEYRNGDGRIYILEVTAGTPATLSAPEVTWASGDTLKISITGTSIEVFQNGVSVTTTSDASIASGQPGFSYQLDNINATAMDDFQAEDAASASSSVVPIIMQQH
jgi:hypothetical protein